jgi:transketolase
MRPNLWVVSALPLSKFPAPVSFLNQISNIGKLIVAEEHVERGGLCWELLAHLQLKSISPRTLKHLYAKKHHYDYYGSQTYLQSQSLLDIKSLMQVVETI